jgi:predicted DsbA family dithiol-disulfide isomerase
MQNTSLPELWEWTEYYCPWSYISAVRLAKIAVEYKGRVRLVERPFPLEVYGGGPPNKLELDQEWWLAALQEPAAIFHAYNNTDWPATTLPAFEAVWCARQQDEGAARDLDLLIRWAFFAESTNIGDRDIYAGLAREVGLELPAFRRLFESSRPREAVLAEGRLGYERYQVRSTPTLMLSSGTCLRLPIAFPRSENERIAGVEPLPCSGDSCYEATRALFEQALAR